MTERRRFVFDTNVLISAALFRDSAPGRALRAAIGEGDILLSPDTIQELHEVLFRRKFDRYLSLTTRKRFITAMLRRAIIVEVEPGIRECRDPRDDKFLDLAVGGNAAFVVASDEDLLSLNPFRGIPVVTPAKLLEIMSRPRP
jgi:putative PIN family toxin of toxin-antitoxin system